MIGMSISEQVRARLADARGNVGDMWVFAGGFAIGLVMVYWVSRG